MALPPITPEQLATIEQLASEAYQANVAVLEAAGSAYGKQTSDYVDVAAAFLMWRGTPGNVTSAINRQDIWTAEQIVGEVRATARNQPPRTIMQDGYTYTLDEATPRRRERKSFSIGGPNA
jgi:hypothetical protein